MNIGAARYWILVRDARYGYLLAEAMDDEDVARVSSKFNEVLDRGPLNLWTGQVYG